MNRYYYISDNLDLLEALQDDLQSHDIDQVRIHVLSEQDAELRTHHLNEVESLAKKDIVRSGLKGAVVGFVLAMIILLVALAAGLMTTVWGIPIGFLAVVILGFCTWEGGLIGAHRPIPEVKRFHDQLKQGQHVLFVDAEDEEVKSMEEAVAKHPKVQPAGTGKAEPGVTSHLRQCIRNLIQALP